MALKTPTPQADRTYVTSLLGLRRALERRIALAGVDAGFSLLEAVIALVIAGGVFGSLSLALIGSVRASQQARQNQNAGDILNKQVEFVRSLDFSGATEITSDLAGDNNLTYTGGTYYLNTSAGAEPIVAASVGLIPQHVQTIVQQNTTYTVATYITKVTDTTNSSANYHRVTVIVQWTVNGVTHSRRSSSFFTDTRRGLPLPRFTIGTSSTYATNVGASLALKVKVTNVGAPDAFNLSASAPPSGGSWTWYWDSNNDGVYSTGDSVLTDSDGDGAKDTGLLQVGSSIVMFAVRTVVAGEPTTQNVLITATSAAQPTASTATQRISDQVLVNPASCSGCNLITYYLHNSTTYGPTVYQGTANNGNAIPMLMDRTSPASTRGNLYNYSTDCSGFTTCTALPFGRYVHTGGAAVENDKTKVASWYYSVPTATSVVAGTAAVTVWVRTADGLGSASTITAYIGSDQNFSMGGTYQNYGSATATVPATTVPGWQSVTIGVPVSAFSINNTKYLCLHIVASGVSDIRLGYDTTGYNAAVVIPIGSGG
jgi:type II secretory pathway pseudopilin PulG